MRIDGPQLLSEVPLRMSLADAAPVVVADDEQDSSIPAELRSWLVDLRLLLGVPFANLVADTELLPPESIRWFYVDRQWTDATVQGAMSVGTVNTDDRAQLTAAYPAVRAELDAEERNVRRLPGAPRRAGEGAPISGFLLRSAAVAGWPGLHVRAFSEDLDEPDDAGFTQDHPSRMRLLRLERLAPAVLMCLFDGIPRVVHVEEPRQGVQFGFDVQVDGAAQGAALRPRQVSDFSYLDRTPVHVRFRPGGSGVVDIQELERDLAVIDGTGAGDGLDAGEYALQLVRFPYRQVFGDATHQDLETVFAPTIAYQAWVDTSFVHGGP